MSIIHTVSHPGVGCQHTECPRALALSGLTNLLRTASDPGKLKNSVLSAPDSEKGLTKSVKILASEPNLHMTHR